MRGGARWAALLALALPGAALAQGKQKAPPETRGFAWLHETPEGGRLVLLSRDTLLVRRNRQLTAYALGSGQPRWEGRKLQHKASELRAAGELLVEVHKGRILGAWDLHGGAALAELANVSGLSERKGRIYATRGDTIEARSINGELAWSWPGEGKRRGVEDELKTIQAFCLTEEGVVIAGARHVVGLSAAGRRSWSYELEAEERTRALHAEGDGLLLRTNTNLHFLSAKRGKRRAWIKAEDGWQLSLRPAKRGGTLVARLGGQGAGTFTFFDLAKGTERAKVEGPYLECARGPGFQSLLLGEASYRVQSSAGRRLFEGEGRIVPWIGSEADVRESYLVYERSEEALVLRRLDEKRGTPQEVKKLAGSWEVVHAPGILLARQGKTLLLVDPATLAETGEVLLPAASGRLSWTGAQVLFEGGGYFGALPAK